MRGPLLERMPPFEGTRVGSDIEKMVPITNGIADISPDSQELLNDQFSLNNNANENNETVR